MPRYLNSLDYNLYCLQDTHFTCEINSSIEREWGYKCVFSSFRSNARGVCILFKNNFEFELLKESHDKNGNYIAIEIFVEQRKITLVNLYGPNKDDPIFYNNIFEIIAEFGNNNFIICGDFNLCLDPDLDSFNYIRTNNPNARNKLLDFIQENNCIDAFRELNPNLKRYTWRRKKSSKTSEIRFLHIK